MRIVLVLQSLLKWYQRSRRVLVDIRELLLQRFKKCSTTHSSVWSVGQPWEVSSVSILYEGN